MTRLNRILLRAAVVFMFALLFMPLLAHVYVGLFNRPVADDYCFTVIAREYGLIGSVDYWYNNWTGTYSSSFFQSLTGLTGLWRFVPSTLTLLWFAALALAVYQLSVRLPRRGLIATAVGAVVVAAAVNGTHNVYQSLYWTSGAITYTAPLIVLTINAGIMVWAVRAHIEQNVNLLPFLALSAGFSMLAGGFSPLFAVAQVAAWSLVFGGVLLFAPRTWKSQALLLIGTALIFSGIAFLILLIAPGNDVRRSRFPDTPSLSSLLNFAYDQTLRFLRRSGWLLAPALIGAIVGALFVPVKKIPVLRLILLMVYMAAAVFLLIMACLFTAGYAMTYAPPPRAYIVPRYGLVLFASGVGLIMGMLVQALLTRYVPAVTTRTGLLWAAAAVATVIILFVSLTFTLDTLDASPLLNSFAQEWDALDDRLRNETPGSSVVVDRFRVEFAEMIGVNRITVRALSNECVADFYGLASIRASS